MSGKYFDFILKYISIASTDQIIRRGESLYKSGAVVEAEYSEANDSWQFAVQGGSLYDVEISGVRSGEIYAECNCPFNWGSILCKHEVAALLHIRDNQKSEVIVEKKAVDKSRKGNEFEIVDYKFITTDYVFENIEFNTQLRLNDYFPPNVKQVEILDEKVKFIINDDYKDYEVVIRLKNGKAFISSSQKTNTIYLSEIEAVALLYIAQSADPDLLDMLMSEELKNEKKKIKEKYGLTSNDNFEDYFIFGFNQLEGLAIFRNSQILLPVKGKIELPVDKLNYTTLEDQIASLNLKEFREERKLGFVFKDYSYDAKGEYEIVPIIGRENKDKSALTTYIKEYYNVNTNKFNIEISENEQKILQIVEDIDEDYHKNEFPLYRRALSYLAREPYVFLSKSNNYNIRKKELVPVKVSENSVTIAFKVRETERHISVVMVFFIEGSDKEIDGKSLLNKGLYMLIKRNVIYPIKDKKTKDVIAEYKGELKMVKEYKDVFFDKVVRPLSQNFRMIFEDNTFAYTSVSLDFNRKQVYLTEMDEHLIIKPQVVYGEDTAVALFASENIIKKEGNEIVEYKRNYELEEDFLDLIAELHPDFEIQKDRKFFHLHYKDFTRNLWFYHFFDAMNVHDVEVFGLKNLKHFKYSPYKGMLSTSIASGEDWFDVGVELSFGEQSVSLKDIRRAVINQEKYIQLKDGSVGLMPEEWLRKLEKYFRYGEISGDSLKVSKLRFSVVDELFDKIDDKKVIEEIAEKRRRLKEFKKISKVSVPQKITAKLRPYQKEGLNWLNFLDEMKWGGILADDMGLGKTLQILTFIQHIIRKTKTPNLIVVPTTLLFNWENEIKKFAPTLKAFYHYGSNRERNIRLFKGHHIVFTTYGILLRDIEFLKDYKFNYMILDESQAIKNPASRRYKASILIQAKNKITLTGTPIENSTFDLFAQMNFVNPGFFGSLNSFREDYSNAIDKQGNEARAMELQKIINPFILRRTKENVASELPSKTEDIIYCEMEGEQRRVYEAYRNNYREKLLDNIEESGLGKSKLMVLEALMRLRQICDSPLLLNDEEISVNQSVKIKEIVRHITNKTAKHKVLIFSQFVSMLSLIKEELNKLNIDYEYLDGQRNSKQREVSVNRFQENSDLRVFLISLKAGGLGLNLTAADYVYIMDPWWNPAVENQAIDRCYRIGQDKNVFAYRMICKDTVEEKILNLQAKKKKIASDIIQTDENIMKTINVNDIAELFS